MRRNSPMKMAALAAAPALVLCALPALAWHPEPSSRSSGLNHSGSVMAARQEIRQSYDLAPGATVRVAGIAGAVTVETGGDRAEVHILRMARTEQELDCYRTDVDSSPRRLAIEHVQFSDREGCQSISARQEVRLRLPRSVDVELSTIAGAVDVGAIDGRLKLESIAGRTSLAGARSLDLSSLAGGLSLNLDSKGGERIDISSVVGPVDIGFAPGADADVRISSVLGSVRSLLPDVELTEENGAYSARVGNGGRALSLSSVVGQVRLRRQ